jgi:hypothetical protein
MDFMRNYQFAAMLTEISNHQMTSEAKKDLEIMKLTMMTMIRDAAEKSGENPNSCKDAEGALALLIMSIHWMLETDLLSLEGGE